MCKIVVEARWIGNNFLHIDLRWPYWNNYFNTNSAFVTARRALGSYILVLKQYSTMNVVPDEFDK